MGKKDDEKLDLDQTLDYCLGQIKTIMTQDMRDLNVQRQEALKFLRSDEDIVPIVKGRSKFTTTDLSDTIEWILPQLMKVFAGKEEVVELLPQGAEDVELVKNTADLVNYQLKRKNDWFIVLNDAFRDGLSLKTSIIKRQWHKETKTMDKSYEDLNDAQFLALTQQPNTEVVKIESKVLQAAVEVQDPFDKKNKLTISPEIKSHNATIRYTFTDEYPLVEAVPPEEIGYHITVKDIRKAPFVYHERAMDKWEIIEAYGQKFFDDIEESYKDMESSASSTGSDVYKDRFQDLGYQNFVYDKESDKWTIYECYYRKKDTGEHWITTLCGDVIAVNEHNVYEGPPFRMGTPIKLSHRATGKSIYDLIKSIHLINTSITRQFLDTVYFNLNGRWVADDTQVTLSDFLTQNRPGGVVRGNVVNGVATGIAPIPPPQIDANYFTLAFQFIQQAKDRHLPVSQAFQGINPNALSDTWRGANQQIQQATQQIEMMASLFAEMLIGPLVSDVVDLNIQFLKDQTAIRVLNTPKIISPDNITNKADVIVNVGIGTGNKQEIIMYMQQLLGIYAQASKAGIPCITPENIYNAIKELVKAMGFKNTQDFVTDPQLVEGVTQLIQTLMQDLMIMQQQGMPIDPKLAQLTQQMAQTLNIKPPVPPPPQGQGQELNGGTFPGQVPPSLPMQPAQPMNMTAPSQGGNFG